MLSIGDLLDDAVAVLPANTATSTTLAVGLAMLTGQCVLWFVFRFLVSSGPWHAEPGYTAHQIVYFPLGVYTAYYGCAHFFAESPATPSARVLQHNAAGYFLAQLQIAVLVLWDIPTGLFVQVLREPIMLAHHVGFVIAAAYVATQNVNSYYALCFFGVVEVSSVPLCFADAFHPKHKEYSAWLETAPVCRAFNEVVRSAFVAVYLAVRGVYFPYVVWGRYVPDMLELLALPPAQRQHVTPAQLWTPFFLGTAFSVLQLYWGHLLIKQVQKILGGGKPPTTKKSH